MPSERKKSSRSVSEAQLAANRRNAQRSTGPRTATGKGASSANALKHGGYEMRGVAISRGVFAEAQQDVDAFIEGVINDLKPRDLVESEVARGVAQALLQRRRAISFEGAELSRAGSHSGSTTYERELAAQDSRYETAELMIDVFDGHVDAAPHYERLTRFMTTYGPISLATLRHHLGSEDPGATDDWFPAFKFMGNQLGGAERTRRWAVEQREDAARALGGLDAQFEARCAAGSLEVLEKTTVIQSRISKAIEQGLDQLKQLQKRRASSLAPTEEEDEEVDEESDIVSEAADQELGDEDET